ncbi:hypothetical protein Cob_v008950 [Colletotrichum orbiculare MAFF 240422]|uniref:Uncharacterized protein n=1 Tax=Colletotrichum orbiculare (strain 104-T / ATCC 96160 / CBS 514.97 / LARS 414 / MAFF 240422) TaxID=1213857 RepID=A0A484FMW6_COLOR|nr:hypothetical protein Cob_v008950 [Colletotrichum orbiculare MAFF 240422]
MKADRRRDDDWNAALTRRYKQRESRSKVCAHGRQTRASSEAGRMQWQLSMEPRAPSRFTVRPTRECFVQARI